MEPKTRIFKKDEHLLHQYEMSRYMYIIKSGKVKVVRKEGKHTIYTKEVGPGGVVGELALIDAMPRTASVVAMERVEALVITPNEIDAINQTLPAWLTALGRCLAFRIRTVISKLERNPESYSLSSIVSLLVYFSVAANGKQEFKRTEIENNLVDILRIQLKKITETLDWLIKENMLDSKGDQLIIPSLVKLESFRDDLKKSITKDYYEIFRP